jgi:hypothetical protein
MLEQGRSMPPLDAGMPTLPPVLSRAPQDFAAGIKALAKAGCQVIVDDIGYLGTPQFSPGILTQAVETVYKSGSLYFAAAGNSAGDSYETNIVPMTCEWVV